jgi:hypothetical protein
MLRKVFAAVLFGILSLSCTTAGERTAPSPPAARCSAARTLEAPFRCHFFELDKAAYVYPLNGSHCYELTDAWNRGRNGYVYFKLHSATTLRVAHGATGACPDRFPVSVARSY